MLKRILAMLLVITMMAGMVGTSAFAEVTEVPEKPAEAAQTAVEPAGEPEPVTEPGAAGEPESTGEPESAREPEPEPEEPAAEPVSFAFLGAKGLDADGTAHYEAALEGESALLTVQTDYAGELIYLWQRLDAESGEYINIDVQLNPTAARQTLELPAAEVMADTVDAYRCAVTSVYEGGALEKYAFFTVISTEEGEAEAKQYGAGITTEAELIAALAEGAVTLDADITLTADLTLTNDLDVGSYTLTVDSGATLTVPVGCKLEDGSDETNDVYARYIIVKDGTLSIEPGGELRANYVDLGYTAPDGAQQNGHLIADYTGYVTANVCSDGSTVTGQNASHVNTLRRYTVYTEAQFEAALGANTEQYRGACIDILADISLTKAYTVPAASNKIINVFDCTLSVENSASLTMQSTGNSMALCVQKNAHILIKAGGSVDVATYEIGSSGSIEVKSGGTLTSRISAYGSIGAFLFGSKATLTVDAGATYNLLGTINISAEQATVTINGIFNRNGSRSIVSRRRDAVIGGSSLAPNDCVYDLDPITSVSALADAIAFANTKTANVTASIVLSVELEGTNAIPANMTLTMNSACTQTSGTLTVNGVLKVCGTLTVANGAGLINNGRIELGESSVSPGGETLTTDGVLTMNGAYSGNGSVALMTELSTVNGTNAASVPDPGQQTEVNATTEAELIAAIQQGASKININGDIALTSSLTVPSTAVLYLNAALTVPDSTTLTTYTSVYLCPTGALNISGTHECNGFMNVVGASVSVLSVGTLEIGESVMVQRSGSLTAETGGTILNVDGHIDITSTGTLDVQAGAQLENRGSANISNIANVSGALINSGYLSIKDGGTLTTSSTGSIVNSGTVNLGSDLNDTQTDGFLVANGAYSGPEVILQTTGSSVTGTGAAQISFTRIKTVRVETSEQLDAALKASYAGFDSVNIMAQGVLELNDEYILGADSKISVHIVGSLTVKTGAALTSQNRRCGLSSGRAELTVESGGSIDIPWLNAEENSCISVESGGELAADSITLKSSSLTVDAGGSLENRGSILLRTADSSLTVNGSHSGSGEIVLESMGATIGGSALTADDWRYNIAASSEEELRAAVNAASANYRVSVYIAGSFSINADLVIAQSIGGLGIGNGAQLTVSAGTLTLQAHVHAQDGALIVADGAKLVNNAGITLGMNSIAAVHPGADSHLVVDGEYEGSGTVTLVTNGSTVTGKNAASVIKTKFINVSTTEQLDAALASDTSDYEKAIIVICSDMSLTGMSSIAGTSNKNLLVRGCTLSVENGASFTASNSVQNNRILYSGNIGVDNGHVIIKNGGRVEVKNFIIGERSSIEVKSGGTLISGEADSNVESVISGTDPALTVEAGAEFILNNMLSDYSVSGAVITVNGDYEPSAAARIRAGRMATVVSGSSITTDDYIYDLFVSSLCTEDGLTELIAFANTTQAQVFAGSIPKHLTTVSSHTIPQNLHFTSRGTWTVSSGTLVVNGELELWNLLTVQAGAGLLNNGKIVVGELLQHAGSTMTLNGEYSGDGEVVLVTGDSVINGTNATDVGNRSSLACDQESLTAALAVGNATITEDLTLTEDLDLGERTLTVENGATLTVSDGVTLSGENNRFPFAVGVTVKNGTLEICDGASLNALVNLGATSPTGVQEHGRLIYDTVNGDVTVHVYSEGSAVEGDQADSVNKYRVYCVYTEAEFEAAVAKSTTGYSGSYIVVLNSMSINRAYSCQSLKTIIVKSSTFSVQNGAGLKNFMELAAEDNGHIVINDGGDVDAWILNIAGGSGIEVKSGGVLKANMISLCGSAPALTVDAGAILNITGGDPVVDESEAGCAITVNGTLNTDMTGETIMLTNVGSTVSGTGVTDADYYYSLSFDDVDMLGDLISFAGTVPARVHAYQAYEGRKLTIDGNYTLPANMTLSLADAELSSGTLTVNGELIIAPRFALGSGAAMVNNGSITVKNSTIGGDTSNGTFTVDGAYSGSGTVSLVTEDCVINGTNAAAVENVRYLGYTQAQLEADLADGEATLTADLTLTRDLNICGKLLTIDGGATLTVPSGVTLSGRASGRLPLGVYDRGPRIAVQNGTINVCDGAVVDVVLLSGLGKTAEDGTQTDGHIILDGSWAQLGYNDISVYSDGSTVTGENADSVSLYRKVSVYTQEQLEAALELDTSVYASTSISVYFSTEAQLEAARGLDLSKFDFVYFYARVYTNEQLEAALGMDGNISIEILDDVSLSGTYTASGGLSVQGCTLSVENGGSLSAGVISMEDGRLAIKAGGSVKSGMITADSSGVEVQKGGTLTLGATPVLYGMSLMGSSPYLTVNTGATLSLREGKGIYAGDCTGAAVTINGVFNRDGERSISSEKLDTAISGASVTDADCYYYTNAETETELAAVIDFAGTMGAEVMVYYGNGADPTTLTQSHVIPKNLTVMITSACMLSSGTLTVSGEVDVWNSLTVGSEARLENNAMIKLVQYAGTAILTVDGAYGGDGAVMLVTEGSAVNGANAASVTNIWQQGEMHVTTEAQLREAIQQGVTELHIDSAITLTSSLSIPGSTVTHLSAALTVASGAVLTIYAPVYMSSNAALNIRGTVTCGGFLDVNGAKVIIFSGGLFDLGESVGIRDGGSFTAESGATIRNSDGSFGVDEGGTLTVKSGARFENRGGMNIRGVANVSGVLENSQTFIYITNGGKLTTTAYGSLINNGAVHLGSGSGGGAMESDGFFAANGRYSGSGSVELWSPGSRVTGSKAAQIDYIWHSTVLVTTSAELAAALSADYSRYDAVTISAGGDLELTGSYTLDGTNNVRLNVHGSLTVRDGASLKAVGDNLVLLRNCEVTVESGGSIEAANLTMLQTGCTVQRGGMLTVGSAEMNESSITVNEGGRLINNGCIWVGHGPSSLSVNGTYSGSGKICVGDAVSTVGGSALTSGDYRYELRVGDEAGLRAAVSFADRCPSELCIRITGSFSISTDLSLPGWEGCSLEISGAELTVSAGTLTQGCNLSVYNGGRLAVESGATLSSGAAIFLGKLSCDAQSPSTIGYLVLDGEYAVSGNGSVYLETEGSSVTGANANAVNIRADKHVTVSSAAELDKALGCADSVHNGRFYITVLGDISLAKSYTLPEEAGVVFDLSSGGLTFEDGGSLTNENVTGVVSFTGGPVTFKSGSMLAAYIIQLDDAELKMQSGSTLLTANGGTVNLQRSALTVESGATFNNAGNVYLLDSRAVINGTYIGKNTESSDTDESGYIVRDVDSEVSGTGISVINSYYSLWFDTQEELIAYCLLAESAGTAVVLSPSCELTVNENISLPENVKMIVCNPLTVSSGTFTVNGMLKLYCADMTVQSGASLVNNGRIEIGAVESQNIVDCRLVMNGAYSGAGDVILCTADSAVTGDAASQISASRVMTVHVDNENLDEKLEADYSAFDKAELILDSDIDVTGAVNLPLQENVHLIVRDRNIRVKNGGSLTVTGGHIELNGNSALQVTGSTSRVTVIGSELLVNSASSLALEGRLTVLESGKVEVRSSASAVNNGTIALGVTGDGTTETLSVQGSYQGKGKIVNSDGDIVRIDGYSIDVTGADRVAGGKSMKLTGAFTPSNLTNTSIVWSLAEGDEEYAKLTPSGLYATLTAKAVSETHTVTVTARSLDGAVTDTLTVEVSPLSQSVQLANGDGSVDNGATLALDIHEADKTIQLAAITLPTDASNEVVWSSSAPAIATVSANGLVTGLKPGVATIKALTKDGSGKYATVKIQVYYADKAARLTATSEAETIPAIGLQNGRTTVMRVFGENREVPMEQGLFTFSIPTSQQAIATVDPETGVITAGGKPGTATVTAALKDDPLKRKATLSVKVIALQTGSVLLTPELSDEIPTVRTLDVNGVETASDIARYELLLDRAEMTGAYTFTINPSAKYSDGVDVASPTLTYTSSDTGVATVAVKNGVVTVTVKAGAYGACTISGVSKDLAKVEGILTVYVRDYAPRLGAKTLILNPNLSAGASLPLYEAYGNVIDSVSLYEYNAVSRQYEDTDNKLSAVYSDDQVVFTANDAELKNCTIKAKLVVSTSGVVSETYEFLVTVTVKRAEPVITVKQRQKFNLFYMDSRTELAVTAKDAVINDIALEATAFDGVYNSEHGTLTVSYSDMPMRNSMFNRVKLLVSVDGYTEPIEKLFTIATVDVKPTLKLSAASSVINISPEMGSRSTSFTVYDVTNKRDLELTQVGVYDGFVSFEHDASRITLTLNGERGGTATVQIGDPNWFGTIALKHTITVQRTAPTAKLATGTLKLNNAYTALTAATDLILSQANQTVEEVVFSSTAAEGSAARAEADKLSLGYADGEITVSIAEGETPKAGTYTFTVTPRLSGAENPLKALTLRVQVVSTVPRVTALSTTLKLNRAYYENDSAATGFKLSTAAGYSLQTVGVEKAARNSLDDGDIEFSFDQDSGKLTAKLTRAVPNGTYSYLLTPSVLCDELEQTADAATVTLKVTVFNNPAISAAVTASGKLDAIKRDGAIIYTVTKLTNINGEVNAVELIGTDAGKFEAVINDGYNARGQKTVSLTLKDQEYATNATYKVQLRFTLDNSLAVNTPVLSVKVTQSALKLKPTAAVTTVFQSQSAPITNRLSVLSPAGAQIAKAELNERATTAALIQALGGAERVAAYLASLAAGESVDLSFELVNSAKLKAGASYALVLDVTPAGCAANVKPTQVKLTVKAAK